MSAPSTLRSSPADALRKVPTHIVTGFLGSGKTTLISQLVAQKPGHERWAILVNEFGRIDIDQALFAERGDVTVMGLPGGCLCCQLAVPLRAGLVNLLRRARPDRLMIEPSGLGHPAGLLDELRGEAFRDVLDIRNIIVLVDARAVDDQRTFNHETFRDQLAMADCAVINKADLASDGQLGRMHRHLGSLWPAKHWIQEVQQGELSLSLLLAEQPGREVRYGPRHAAHAHHHGDIDDIVEAHPEPGRAVRKQATALGYETLGWCWHAQESFDRERLSIWLDGLPENIRVKGIFHTTLGWYAHNRAEASKAWASSSWRKDSRLELIGKSLPAPDVMEQGLNACLASTGAEHHRLD